MKDELLPQIPQEEMLQTHSMYEQLRRTSQKWFARSHKRIFDGRSQHQQNDSSKCTYVQLTSHTKPEELAENNDDKIRLMALMREQIEIGCQQFVGKMKILMQEQTKKIKTLGDLLGKNQRQLSTKSKMIEQIVQCIMEFKRRNETGTNQQVSKRLLDLEQKLVDIERILNQDSTLQRIFKMQSRLKSSLTHLSDNYLERLQQIRYDLEDRVDRVQKLIQMNLSTSKGMRSSIDTSRSSGQIEKKLTIFQSDINDLKIQIQSFKAKEYSYDNYKLQQTQSKLIKMDKILSKINEQSHNSRNHILSPHLGLKGSQTTQLTQTHTYCQKSKLINNYKSLINNRKMKEQSCSSESQNESEVQATVVMDEQGSVSRFMRVIMEARIPRPVQIEVDQTGYVKSVETGMYLVDSIGNGFEFSPLQLQYLLTRGFIQI